jgi:hypothetical protein
MLQTMVQESATNPGTATTINLAGAVAGRRGFIAAFGSGAPVFYFLDDGTQAEWGEGVVTAGAPNTLTRTTVLGNTAGTLARLNFTGVTRVYGEVPAERFGWLKLASASPSGVANADITLPLAFNQYRLTVWAGALTVSGGFCLRQSTDGGATYAAGASDYVYVFVGANSGTPASGTFTTSLIDFTSAVLANDPRTQINLLIDPGSASRTSSYVAQASLIDSGSARRVMAVAGGRVNNGRVTNIRLLGGGGGNLSCSYLLEGII